MKNNKKIICFSGAHGTGKTTSARKLVTDLEELLGEEVGFVHDVARSCPFPIVSASTNSSPEAQQWIFCETLRRQLEALGRYRITVSDRSIVDCVAYSYASGFEHLADGMLAFSKILKHDQKTEEFFIFNGLSNWEVCFRGDGIRQNDKRFAEEVESNLLMCHRKIGNRLYDNHINEPISAGDIMKGEKKVNEKREKLADLCHQQWSGWMEYLFSKSIHYEPEKAQNLEGTVIIPKWAVNRWVRQMNTLYSELSEIEKENDRAEADRILDVLSEKREKFTAETDKIIKMFEAELATTKQTLRNACLALEIAHVTRTAGITWADDSAFSQIIDEIFEAAGYERSENEKLV